MINLLIWLAAFLCPNPNHTIENHGCCNLIHVTHEPVSTLTTGGETGGHPTPPGPPPPPPGGN